MKPFKTWHLIRQTDLNRTKRLAREISSKQIKNWLDDKDEAERFGNEWKIVATKTQTQTHKDTILDESKTKAHRIIYESVENYATIACIFRQYRQA